MKKLDFINEEELLKKLDEKEKKSRIKYDENEEDEDLKNVEIPEWIEKETEKNNFQSNKNNLNLGKVKTPLAMEEGWKNLPIERLPSKGFGYPKGFELAIRAATVSEIRHWSTIDESDRLDIDDKLNNIITKCMKIRWEGGPLEAYDLWYEDRFYVVMSIRDLTFIRGENKIFLPVVKNCNRENCQIPDKIELKANLLDSFQLDEELIKRYNYETYSFNLVAKDGSFEMNLYIPTVGVTTICRKIIAEKKERGKKYDKSFASVAPFIIPNWRNLNEKLYDQYERESQSWSPLQFSVVDQISKKINFATKSRIYTKCDSCGGEVTADISFPEGLRSLFIISDIFGQLL